MAFLINAVKGVWNVLTNETGNELQRQTVNNQSLRNEMHRREISLAKQHAENLDLQLGYQRDLCNKQRRTNQAQGQAINFLLQQNQHERELHANELELTEQDLTSDKHFQVQRIVGDFKTHLHVSEGDIEGQLDAVEMEIRKLTQLREELSWIVNILIVFVILALLK